MRENAKAVRAAGDVASRWLSRAAIVLVGMAAVMGWGASFVGLHAYGMQSMSGFTYSSAWLVPGTFDGAAFACTLLTYRSSINGRSAFRGRILMWGFTAVSSWINWIHQPSHQAQIVAAGLPIAAVAVFDIVLIELRADFEARHGRRGFRLRPGLLLLRWMVDRTSTREAFRRQVIDIPVEEIAGLGPMPARAEELRAKAASRPADSNTLADAAVRTGASGSTADGSADTTPVATVRAPSAGTSTTTANASGPNGSTASGGTTARGGRNGTADDNGVHNGSAPNGDRRSDRNGAPEQAAANGRTTRGATDADAATKSAEIAAAIEAIRAAQAASTTATDTTPGRTGTPAATDRPATARTTGPAETAEGNGVTTREADSSTSARSDLTQVTSKATAANPTAANTTAGSNSAPSTGTGSNGTGSNGTGSNGTGSATSRPSSAPSNSGSRSTAPTGTGNGRDPQRDRSGPATLQLPKINVETVEAAGRDRATTTSRRPERPKPGRESATARPREQRPERTSADQARADGTSTDRKSTDRKSTDRRSSSSTGSAAGPSRPTAPGAARQAGASSERPSTGSPEPQRRTATVSAARVGVAQTGVRSPAPAAGGDRTRSSGGTSAESTKQIPRPPRRQSGSDSAGPGPESPAVPRGTIADKREAARRDYLAAVDAERTLTGAELGSRYGFSASWGRQQIAAAREQRKHGDR